MSAKSEFMPAWEDVHANSTRTDVTERLRLPGGWLFRNIRVQWSEDMPEVISMVFVPEVV